MPRSRQIYKIAKNNTDTGAKAVYRQMSVVFLLLMMILFAQIFVFSAWPLFNDNRYEHIISINYSDVFILYDAININEEQLNYQDDESIKEHYVATLYMSIMFILLVLFIFYSVQSNIPDPTPYKSKYDRRSRRQRVNKRRVTERGEWNQRAVYYEPEY